MRVLLFGLWFASFAFGYPMTPNAVETAGELCRTSDRDFVEYRYPEKIPYCLRNVSSALKARVYDNYGIPKAERKDYTIDHLVPLSLGGDNQALNLWPEHKKVKALRPALEYDLYLELRAGNVSQADAVEEILFAKFHPDAEVLQSIAR